MMEWIKKEHRVLRWAFWMSLLLTLPFILFGPTKGHDTSFHLNRLQELAFGFQTGQWLPTVAFKTLNYAGYANAFFYPSLFLYPAGFLKACGIPTPVCLETIFYMTHFMSFVGMAFATRSWLRLQSDHEKWEGQVENFSLLAATCYVFFPYRLWNIFVRCALGEVLSAVFLPFVLVGLREWRKGSSQKAQKYLLIGMLGLLFSHVLTFTAMLVYCVFYVLIHLKTLCSSPTKIYTLVRPALATIGLGAFFWVGFLEQMSSQTFKYSIYQGAGPLSRNQVSLQSPMFWGVVVILLTCLLVTLYQRKRKEAFAWGSILLVILMTTELFPWHYFDQVPLLNKFQFPWRSYLFLAYPVSLLLTQLVLRQARFCSWSWIKWGTVCLMALLLFKMNDYRVLHREKLPMNIHFLGYVVGCGEYLPGEIDTQIQWLTSSEESYHLKGDIYEWGSYLMPKQHLKVFRFDVLKEGTTVETPILWYKGYEVRLNGESMPAQKGENGYIAVENLPVGTYQLEVQYHRTLLQQLGEGISLFTLVGLVILNQRTKKATL